MKSDNGLQPATPTLFQVATPRCYSNVAYNLALTVLESLYIVLHYTYPNLRYYALKYACFTNSLFSKSFAEPLAIILPVSNT